MSRLRCFLFSVLNSSAGAPALASLPRCLTTARTRRGHQGPSGVCGFWVVDFAWFLYEYEFIFMNIRLFVYGLIGWVGATAALRVGGQHLLRPGDWKGTVVLYTVSFALMAWLARRLLLALRIRQEQLLAALVSLLLPTLLLDPFSSAFFPALFPNMLPEVAGAFGGWMLISCAGALVGGVMYTARPAG